MCGKWYSRWWANSRQPSSRTKLSAEACAAGRPATAARAAARHWRGPISPKCRYGERREVSGRSGRLRALAVASERVLRESLDLGQGPVLAGCPGFVQAGVPAHARPQTQFVEREAGRRLRRRGDGGRRWQRPRQCVEPGRAIAPERREDAIRLALARADLPRLVQQRRVVALALEPGLAQRCLDVRVALDERRIVEPVPVDPPGAGLACDVEQRLERTAPAQAQSPAAGPQRRIQRREALVQPPTARAAGRPVAVLPGGVHVQRDHVPRLRAGRAQRGVVGQAQVATEPDDCAAGVAHESLVLGGRIVRRVWIRPRPASASVTTSAFQTRSSRASNESSARLWPSSGSPGTTIRWRVPAAVRRGRT